MRVDSHQHFWQLARGDYDWTLGNEKVLHRDYFPADLNAHLEQSKIDKTIVVQAAPTLKDTEFMLGLAKEHDSIAGVVGWMDLERSDYRQQYRYLLEQPGLVGIRVMIQSMSNADDVLRPASLAALQFLAAENFPVDLLLRSHQLSSVLQLLHEVPNLRGVIDHCAKPDIAKGQWEPWASQIEELASYPALYCKLSGMVTEADHEGWTVKQFIPYVRHIVQAFGTDRVMFGSDWPVCLFTATYPQIVGLLEFCVGPDWTDEERAALYGGNASRFYRLESLPE